MNSADTSRTSAGGGDGTRVVLPGDQAGTVAVVVTGVCFQRAERVPGGGTRGGIQRSVFRQAGDERFAISVNTQVLANGAAPTAHKNNQYIVCLLPGLPGLPGLLGLLDWCCWTA